MKLPNFSNMMRVGQMRHVQFAFEQGPFKNPDHLAHRFLSPFQIHLLRWQAALRLNRWRAEPFYAYLIARTRYYDEAYQAAIAAGVDVIVNIGCGSDTRAYRFAPALKARGIRVLECDQPEAIGLKREIASRHWPIDHVTYLPLDLNSRDWRPLKDWLDLHRPASVFVLMEGVSPYIGEEAFGLFLDFLAGLPAGSRLAYDFKLLGVSDRFGMSRDSGTLFRLPEDRDAVAAYHRRHGFRLEAVQWSADLAGRLLSQANAPRAALFKEDGLVQLGVGQSIAGESV